MQRRYWLFGGVGLAAAAAGAGLAWRRLQPRAVAQEQAPAWAALWSLTVQTREGGSLSLSQFKGQRLVVNFWATWCPPCIEEMPMLNRFHEAQRSKGWQVVGLATDQPASVARFIEQKDIRFPNGVLGGQALELSRLLGNASGGLPYTVVISPQGQVVAQKTGRLTENDLLRWQAEH